MKRVLDSAALLIVWASVACGALIAVVLVVVAYGWKEVAATVALVAVGWSWHRVLTNDWDRPREQRFMEKRHDRDNVYGGWKE